MYGCAGLWRSEVGALLRCLEPVFQAEQAAASPAAAWTSRTRGAAGGAESLDGILGCSKEADEVPGLEQSRSSEPSAGFVQLLGDAGAEPWG